MEVPPLTVKAAVDVSVPATVSGPVSVKDELWVNVLPELTVTPAIVYAPFTVTLLLIVTVSVAAGTQLQFQVAVALQLPFALVVCAAAIVSRLDMLSPTSETIQKMLTINFIRHFGFARVSIAPD
jgi:hypothetical protein